MFNKRCVPVRGARMDTGVFNLRYRRRYEVEGILLHGTAE